MSKFQYWGEEVSIVDYNLDREVVVLLTSECKELLVSEGTLPAHKKEIAEVKTRSKIHKLLLPHTVEAQSRMLRVLLNSIH